MLTTTNPTRIFIVITILKYAKGGQYFMRNTENKIVKKTYFCVENLKHPNKNVRRARSGDAH